MFDLMILRDILGEYAVVETRKSLKIFELYYISVTLIQGRSTDAVFIIYEITLIIKRNELRSTEAQ